MSQFYLILCECSWGTRWFEIIGEDQEPLHVSDRAAHYGPVEALNDNHSIMDAIVSLASSNDFALDDSDTWPLEC